MRKRWLPSKRVQHSRGVRGGWYVGTERSIDRSVCRSCFNSPVCCASGLHTLQADMQDGVAAADEAKVCGVESFAHLEYPFTT